MTTHAPPREALNFFWFIPTHGDGAYLGAEKRARRPEFGYFKQVATAVDQLGFEGALLPTGQSCEDSWIVATGLATVTERLKFLVALRPGVTSPAFAARQAVALDRLSGGRLLLNVVVGGNPRELAGDGIFLDHDARYRQGREFLDVWTRLVTGETVDFDGEYYKLQGARVDFPPAQLPRPPLYFGGSSEAGQDLAAEAVDLYLTWAEPLADVAQKLDSVRRKAAARGSWPARLAVPRCMDFFIIILGKKYGARAPRQCGTRPQTCIGSGLQAQEDLQAPEPSLLLHYGRSIFTAQNSPHIAQTSSLACSPRRVSTISGSRAAARMPSQSRFFLAWAMAFSLARAWGRPRATSPACAAMREAITPARTSSISGRVRCSAGVR